MSITVRIPAPMRRFTAGERLASVEAGDLRQCIDALNAQFPGIKSHICDEKGDLYRFANIFINGEDIRFLREIDTPLKSGDEVSIVPAAAGGA